MNKSSKVPALDVAKAKSDGNNPDAIKTLGSGVRVRLVPVAATLLEEVRKRVPDPAVPQVWIEEKQRNEENYSDPVYITALRETEDRRNSAIMDAIILFGVELVDGLPENDEWVKKLKYMEKLGDLDLSKFDFDDELDLEFMYKRYVLSTASLMMEVSRLSGITEEEVKEGERPFQGN